MRHAALYTLTSIGADCGALLCFAFFSSTLMYPAPLMPSTTTCLQYDETLGQFYSAGVEQYGSSDTWKLSIFVIEGDEFQFYTLLKTSATARTKKNTHTHTHTLETLWGALARISVRHF